MLHRPSCLLVICYHDEIFTTVEMFVFDSFVFCYQTLNLTCKQESTHPEPDIKRNESSD